MNHFRRWIWVPLLAVSGLALLISVQGSTAEPPEAPAVRKVKVAEVRRQPTVRTVRFPGVLRAKDRANLAFTLGGRLIAKYVEEGDLVEKGQTLALIDQEPFKHAKNQAEARILEIQAQVRQARNDRDRVEKLFKAKAVTEEEWERTHARMEGIEAGLSAAKAAKAEAERQLTETALRAPFSGQIVSTHLEPGEFARPGVPAMILSGSDGLEMAIQIPETMIGHLVKGNEVTVDFPLSGNRQVQAVVTNVGSASEGNGLFPVTVRFPSGNNLRAGLSAVIHLQIRDQAAIAVPVTSVINPGGSRPQVFQVVDGKLRRTDVEVHGLREGWVSVSGTLSEGDLVIAGGHAGFIEGDQVEAIQ